MGFLIDVGDDAVRRDGGSPADASMSERLYPGFGIRGCAPFWSLLTGSHADRDICVTTTTWWVHAPAVANFPSGRPQGGGGNGSPRKERSCQRLQDRLQRSTAQRVLVGFQSASSGRQRSGGGCLCCRRRSGAVSDKARVVKSKAKAALPVAPIPWKSGSSAHRKLRRRHGLPRNGRSKRLRPRRPRAMSSRPCPKRSRKHQGFQEGTVGPDRRQGRRGAPQGRCRSRGGSTRCRERGAAADRPAHDRGGRAPTEGSRSRRNPPSQKPSLSLQPRPNCSMMRVACRTRQSRLPSPRSRRRIDRSSGSPRAEAQEARKVVADAEKTAAARL